MLETQKRWYLPAPTVLGWHIGLWNLIGAIGFTLCGALGFASSSSDACEIALTWSTFIGSWAFLVSLGFIQFPTSPRIIQAVISVVVLSFCFYTQSVFFPLSSARYLPDPHPTLW